MIYNAKLPFEKLKDLKYSKLLGTIAWAGDAFMDGIGLRPLSTEWDYEYTKALIYEEFFHQVTSGPRAET